MRKRDKLYKEIKSTGNHLLWSEFLSLKNKINSTIKRSKFYYFRNKLSNNPKQTWAVVNSWRKPNNDSSTKIDADILARHYSEYPKKLNGDLINPPNFAQFLNHPTQHNFTFKEFSIEDVELCVRALNNSRATGPDGISNTIWKAACPFMLSI